MAISSAIWGNFNLKHTRFIDAMDADDYDSIDKLVQSAADDGFPEFKNLVNHSGNLGPASYAWSLCRYFRDLQNKDSEEPEFLMHDDMHGRHFKHFHVDRWMMCHIYNSSILKMFCHVHDVDFNCFLFNTESVGFKSVQPHVFNEVVVGTNELNLKAGLYSPKGASEILKRLRHQISVSDPTPAGLLRSLKSVEDWNVSGIFSTSEPLFLEYPKRFLGSDVVRIPPLQGHFENIFSDVKPS